MTRLITEWIENMEAEMEEYNRELLRKTGYDLAKLAAKCCDVPSDKMDKLIAKSKVAVVPITQGQGLISKFSQSVAAIVRTMGCEAFVTEHTDVDGIYDAVLENADVVFFADDIRYLALNLKNGKAGDNNYGTALGYIQVMEALKKINNRDESEEILVIGYGIVGQEAVKILNQKHMDFAIFDKDFDKIKELPNVKLDNIKDIKKYRNILDFTNVGGWLTKEYLAEDAIIATPGIPLSLDEEARNIYGEKTVSDFLEIGTAIMLGLALC
ncbi:MAG: 3-methylornithyl-N6-L-lysine dehydrogenase PylD [Anaerovoracaceae bacterium]